MELSTYRTFSSLYVSVNLAKLLFFLCYDMFESASQVRLVSSSFWDAFVPPDTPKICSYSLPAWASSNLHVLRILRYQFKSIHYFVYMVVLLIPSQKIYIEKFSRYVRENNLRSLHVRFQFWQVVSYKKNFTKSYFYNFSRSTKTTSKLLDLYDIAYFEISRIDDLLNIYLSMKKYINFWNLFHDTSSLFVRVKFTNNSYHDKNSWNWNCHKKYIYDICSCRLSGIKRRSFFDTNVALWETKTSSYGVGGFRRTDDPFIFDK